MTDRDRLIELAERAGVDADALHVGVVHGDDGLGRIGIASALKPEWGDHLRIEFMPESSPGHWYFAHFSPERAELIAAMLLQRAKALRALATKETDQHG